MMGRRRSSLNAASATYFMSADDKKDPDFRFPGFFTGRVSHSGQANEDQVTPDVLVFKVFQLFRITD